MSNRLQAIVFDFDGVIADSEPLHLQAFQEALETVGITLTTEEYVGRYLGLDDTSAFRAVAEHRAVTLSETTLKELLTQKARRFRKGLAAGRPVFPGAAMRIREWSERVPLAVASGALRTEIETTLQSAGLLECFRAIVAAEDSPAGKPAPDPYLRALARLKPHVAAARGRSSVPGHDDPEACCSVAIEDSRWGIESARRAGLRTVAVTTSYPAIDLYAADLIVSGFEELSFDDLQALVESRRE
jgi:beta-phosphoglucomutase